MVFPVGKRKISSLSETNTKANSTLRRPLPTTSSNDTNRSSKLKTLNNNNSNDLSNKNLKLKSSKQVYDESPKSKLNKLNEMKLNRTSELNKKGNSKQTHNSDQSSSHNTHHHHQQTHYPYADNYNEDLFSFESEETFQKREKEYEKHIKALQDQLEKLKQFEELAQEKKLNSTLVKQSISDLHADDCNYLSKFLSEIQRVEKESTEYVSVVKNWYELQKHEIEQQYTVEQKRAVQEFQDKRRELKDTLRNENEEKRKKVEIDRCTADINMDNSDPKPTTTRKLRRRFNAPISNLVAASNVNFDFTMEANTYDIDSEALGIGCSSLMSSTSVLLQSGVMSTAALGLTAVSSALCSNVNSNGSNVNNYYANNLTATNNERKRKFGPASITFTISEEEINEDLKFLS